MSIALIHNGVLVCDDSQQARLSPCHRFAVGVIGTPFDETQLSEIWELLERGLEIENQLCLSNDSLGFLGNCEFGKTSIQRRVLILTKVGAWVVTRGQNGVPLLVELDDTSPQRAQGTGNVDALKLLDSGYDAIQTLKRICSTRSRDNKAPGKFAARTKLRGLKDHLVGEA